MWLIDMFGTNSTPGVSGLGVKVHSIGCSSNSPSLSHIEQEEQTAALYLFLLPMASLPPLTLLFVLLHVWLQQKLKYILWTYSSAVCWKREHKWPKANFRRSAFNIKRDFHLTAPTEWNMSIPAAQGYKHSFLTTHPSGGGG